MENEILKRPVFAQTCLSKFFVSLQWNSLSIGIKSSDSVCINIFFSVVCHFDKTGTDIKVSNNDDYSSLQGLDVCFFICFFMSINNFFAKKKSIHIYTCMVCAFYCFNQHFTGVNFIATQRK